MRALLPEQSWIDGAFARDLRGSALQFEAGCQEQGLVVNEARHPLPGPDGEATGLRWARLGQEHAQAILVILSGVHGPELMCGSGIQVALLRSQFRQDLPPEMAILFVHAVNPWGAARLSRTNEDNVDLCRNFLDFSEPLPLNPGYDAIGRAFEPGISTGTADALLAGFAGEHGSAALDRAVWGGQYTHPDGFSFGGNGATWSRRQLEALLARECSGAKRIAVLDCHSGVGPYGYGLAVCMHAGERLARARRWFGEWVIAPREPGAEGYYPVTGHTSDGYERLFPDSELTAIVLEFGTYPLARMTALMRHEHALRLTRGDRDPALRDAREAVRAAYCPDDPAWRYAVWTRAAQAIRQALAGLAAD